jgi:hypothetical protein
MLKLPGLFSVYMTKEGNMTRQIMRYIVIAMVLFGLFEGPIRAADLHSVLAMHLAALGDRDSLEAVMSVAMYTSVTYMSLEGKSESFIKFPSGYYERVVLPVGSQANGFDGITAWASDFNGIVRQQSPDEQKPIIDNLYFQSYSYVLPDRMPGKVAYRGDTAISGTSFYYLALFPEGGDSMSVFINAENGRMEYTSEIISGIRMISHYTDFRMVHGISTPYRVSVESPDAPYRISAVLDSIKYNAVIPDSVFTMPGSAEGDFVFRDGMDSSVIPLQFSANRLSIKVKINGFGPYLFILDSGAGTTLISSRLAGDLGIETIGDVPVRGVGGYGNVAFGRIDSMVIGDVLWKLTRVNIFDFGNLQGGGLGQINGILGYDFFVRFPMKIDFSRGRIVLYNPEKSVPHDIGNSLPIDIYYQLPLVTCGLDGQPIRVAFDLGAEMGLFLRRSSRWYRSVGEKETRDWSSRKIEGLGGMQTVVSGRADSLQIGSMTIEKPAILVSAGDSDVPFPDYIEGFVGVDVLKRFVLLIDYPKNRIQIGAESGVNK